MLLLFVVVPMEGGSLSVYNVILEKWSDVVSNVLYPGLLEIGLGDLSIEQKCELKTRLVSVICKKDMIGALMKKMEVSWYIFSLMDDIIEAVVEQFLKIK